MSVLLFSSRLRALKAACATTCLTPAPPSPSRSSPSSAAETRTSPCSMPSWSRSCFENRAWQPLPRSWQNLKPSREVFANQDFNQNSEQRKGMLARHFSTEICEVKQDFFSLSLLALFWKASIKGLTAEVDGE